MWRRAAFSPLRYSRAFLALQEILAYRPREEMLLRAMEFVNGSRLEGHYLEFGVFEGATFVAAYHLAQCNNLPRMRFYAFDSFRGLPCVSPEERRYFGEGEFACDEETFKRNVFGRGVDPGRVTIVPGFFHESLGEHTKAALGITKAAIVWIDCDLYESTVPVLDFIRDWVDDGTVLIFDDWFCFSGDPNRGEQRALREWLAKNQDIRVKPFFRFSWAGRAFIVRMAEAPGASAAAGSADPS